MNTSTVAPTHLSPVMIDPADVTLPPTEPIDITAILQTLSERR